MPAPSCRCAGTACADRVCAADAVAVVQGLAHIKQNVHLKPAGLDSKLHKRLKMTVQKATQKMDKVRWLLECPI